MTISFLLGGIMCAAFGGELFVRGSAGVASVLRIAPSIIRVTVAAFATSIPELSVAINSGLAGKSQLSLGDALGRNIFNISLVLGTTLLISGIPVSIELLKRDAPVAILAPFMTAILLIDGMIDRSEGLFTLALKNRAPSNGKVRVGDRVLPLVQVVAGLFLLVAAGWLIVHCLTPDRLSTAWHRFCALQTVGTAGAHVLGLCDEPLFFQPVIRGDCFLWQY